MTIRKAFTPTGRPIIGLLEQINGIAYAHVHQLPNGQIAFTYEGETEVLWDTQLTQADDKGRRLFVDDNHEIWNETELVFKKVEIKPRRAKRQKG